jgi:regulator of sirC expression with transglutaminase-like and TPR domain
MIQSIMAPPSRRAILVRILRNLKHTYLANASFSHALAAVERILLLTPDDADEVRDRGLLHFRLGAYHRALEDLEYYATLAPAANDLPEIQKYARTLAEHMAQGN